jgi:putative transposase
MLSDALSASSPASSISFCLEYPKTTSAMPHRPRKLDLTNYRSINAFSEAQFKTQKYQPDYPKVFDGIVHARTWCEHYFTWYNHEHHHSGLAGFTPEQVFTERYRQVAQDKRRALDACYRRTPERFVRGRPTITMPPQRVVINPVTPEELAAGVAEQVNFPTLSRAAKARDKYNLSLN